MHTIRLRYPWTKQPHADKAVAAEPAAIEIRLDPLEGPPVRLDGDVTLEIQTGDEAKA